MALPSRPGITGAHQAERWRRWLKGEPILEICRALGAYRSTVSATPERYGGFTPPVRKRAPCARTRTEREEIFRGLSAGHSMREIARALGRSPSTISREIGCNGGAHCYRATRVDELAWERSRRPKSCRLAQHGTLRYLVATNLVLDWSPDQIAGWLKRSYPDDETLYVSSADAYIRQP